jgi:hypothetical protein
MSSLSLSLSLSLSPLSLSLSFSLSFFVLKKTSVQDDYLKIQFLGSCVSPVSNQMHCFEVHQLKLDVSKIKRNQLNQKLPC